MTIFLRWWNCNCNYLSRTYGWFQLCLSASKVNCWGHSSHTLLMSHVLVQLGFIYVVPLHVLEFCSAVVSNYKFGFETEFRRNNNMSLDHMFQNSIDISNMKNIFITFLYMFTLSNCLLTAFLWTISFCYSFCSVSGCYIYIFFFAMICCLALGTLLMVYLEHEYWDIDAFPTCLIH